MLRIFIIVLVVFAVVIFAIVGRFFFSNTDFDDKSKFLYIHTGQATKDNVMRTLEEESLVKNPASFNMLATQMDVWQSLRPGRYEIKKRNEPV